MRAAFVCADGGVPVFGCKGCSIHVQEIIRAMLRRGWQVELFASSFGGPPPLDLQSVVLHSIPDFRPTLEAPNRPVTSGNQQLRSLLHQNGPFDLVYERYSLWSCGAQLYCHETEIPSVLEINAPLIEEQAKYRKLAQRQLAEEIASQVFGAASVLVAVSEEVAGYLRSKSVSPERVRVIENGVNTDRFHSQERTGDNPLTVGFVGSLKPWHGVDVLIEAFKSFVSQVPESELLIVGDGPEKDSLMRQVLADSEFRTGSVIFTGAVSHADIPELLANVDVAVAPYPQLSGFYFSPLKVFEYMAAGCAVIASNIGAPSRLIRHGVNGLLCEPGNAIDLADALLWLQRNPEERRHIAQAGCSLVRQNHSWDHVLQRTIDSVCRNVNSGNRGLSADVQVQKTTTCNISV